MAVCLDRGMMTSTSLLTPASVSAPKEPRHRRISQVQQGQQPQPRGGGMHCSALAPTPKPSTLQRPRWLLQRQEQQQGLALGLGRRGPGQAQGHGSAGVGQALVVQGSAVEANTNGAVTDRWWEKNTPPNMADLHSTQEFVGALAEAGEKLVVVEFFGTWCGSCRALFPKLCRLAADYPDVLFYKIDFDANKPLCKSLNIRVLPFFHFYRGASGRLDAFPASISKLQRLKDALAEHSTDRCSLGPPAGPEQVLHPDLVPEAALGAPPPIPR